MPLPLPLPLPARLRTDHYFATDGVHPNQAGHQTIADADLSALVPFEVIPL